MTEKRYKRLVSSIDYYYCIDTNDDKGLTEDDMLNRLNEQDERIKELEREKKSYMDDAIKFEKECKRLYNNLRLTDSDLYYEKIVHDKCKKENEQLKEENNRLKQDNEKTKESEENKQLKSKERYCVHCKHLYLDRIVGMWCDIHEGEWGNIDAEYCPDYEKE